MIETIRKEPSFFHRRKATDISTMYERPVVGNLRHLYTVFPLAFLAWDYYNSGSFVHSCITCCRDFLWPAAVVVAKAMNASPYQMLATNVGGIAWTVYNCFFAEHDEPEAAAEDDKKDFTNPNTLRGKITAKRDSLRKKW